MTTKKSFQNYLKTIHLSSSNYLNGFLYTFIPITHLSTFLKDN